MRKRLLAVLLTVSLLVAMLVVPAAAVDASTFTDLNPNGWYMKYIDWATANDYMIGMTSTTFEPNTTLSRAMFVTLLARYDGADTFGEANDIEAPFDDVASGKWYTAAVAWGKETGVVKGTSETTFDPAGEITREQMAAMLNRYVEYYTARTGKEWKFTEDTAVTAPADGLTDLDTVADWAKEEVAACIEKGVMIGVTETLFMPKKNSTRAEAATVMYRLAWGLSDDLLHRAVENGVVDLSVTADKINAIIDEYGAPYFVTGSTSVTIPATTNPPGTVEEGYYDIVATAEASLDRAVLPKIVAAATYYACQVIGAEADAPDAGYTVSDVHDTVKAVAAELGIELADQTARQIADQVWEKMKAQARIVWAEFKLEYDPATDGDQVYLFDNVVISGKDGELFTIYTNNGTGTTMSVSSKEGLKLLAKEIAKQMHTKAQADYADKIYTAVELQAVLDIKFNTLADRTKVSYPNYTLTLNLNLDSDGALGYQYAGGMDNFYIYGAKQTVIPVLNGIIDGLAKKLEGKIYDKYLNDFAFGNEEQAWNMTYSFEGGTDTDQLVGKLAEIDLDLSDYKVGGKTFAELPVNAQRYVLARVSDWMNDNAAAQDETFVTVEGRPEDGWASAELPGALAYAMTLSLNDVVDYATDERVAEKAADIAKYLPNLAEAIGWLPESAVVKADAFGADATKADLANVQAAAEAGDVAGTIAAAAALIKGSGFANITLGDLVEGVVFNVTWHDYDYSACVHVVID